MTNPGDPAPAAIEAEFPGWHVWQGINQLWYVRYPRSSPPIVLGPEENTTELRAAVASKARMLREA